MQEIPGYYPLKPAGLPTEGSAPFEAVSVDFADPMGKRPRPNKGKAYILLLACGLTRSVHLGLLPNLTAEEFIKPPKRVAAVQGKGILGRYIRITGKLMLPEQNGLMW